jgi:hypothetical protein
VRLDQKAGWALFADAGDEPQSWLMFIHDFRPIH